MAKNNNKKTVVKARSKKTKDVSNKKDTTTMSNAAFNQLMSSTSLLRSDALTRLLYPGKNIDYECGYPPDIVIDEYERMFSREGLAARVVGILPEESWAMNPIIKRGEETKDSDFDKKWESLQKALRIYHYLLRIDVLSGIGRFGILLLGLDDGGELLDPVEGVNDKTGEKEGNKEHKLLYLKPFDEKAVTIDSKEVRKDSPRFGLPVLYNVQFENVRGDESSSGKVHWTRVIHIADNRQTSDMFGIPRMMQIYNRLLDVGKIMAGSGEMFWKGGFQGLGFETFPENSEVEIDTDSLKEQVREYAIGLQRFLAVQGMKIKSLAPNVADPTGHLKVQIQYIALSLGIPYRIFIGTEEAKLASTQDTKTWNRRVNKRREDYVSPLLIRPLIDRLIVFGVLPEADDYIIEWPDLDSPSDKEKMEVAQLTTEAMAKYVAAGVEAFMTPADYMIHVLKYTKELAETIAANAIGFIKETEGDEDDDDDDDDIDEPKIDRPKTKKKKAKKKKSSNE